MKDAFGQPQSILVLGGGSDIARATVESLIKRRCRNVVLAGRRPEVLERVAADLRRSHPDADLSVSTAFFDALARESHEKVVRDLFKTNGGFDVVMVAFGILGDQVADQEDPEAAARVVEVNFTGAVSSILASVKELRAQGTGTIVVLSSVAGVRVRAANFIYGSSKAGLDGFCQGLADALEGSGVKLMIVRPGFVTTKMTAGLKKAPLATTPEAVGEAIVRGLESDGVVVWVPAVLRYVMALMKLLPRSLFRRLPA
jgi:decaprenylphospho-beta-D-erythro-pentofuranosid-2-ulose 2-reductase